MQVLFTHGYFLCDDPKEQEIMRPYPPLGLLYLSAWLDKHGLENAVFDTTFSTKKGLKDYLLLHRPRIVALYANMMTKQGILEIAAFIHAELADALVVMGGSDVTHNAADYLANGADLLVIGEGEQTMLEICMSAQTMTPGDGPAHFGHINGIAFLQPDGLVFKTPPREKLRDIDVLPFPNRSKIDLQQYFDAWKTAHGESAVSINTQRGCPYTCRWCSTPVFGQSYRRHSPQHVVDEIVLLQTNYDFDLIWFVDDVFTIHHKWLQEFCDELQRRSVSIRFECTTRADRMNAEVIELLRACGCFRVWIGSESGSQPVIDAMNRRLDVQQVREVIRTTRAAGIEAGTFVMLGYPGETDADIVETVQHLREANPDLFTINTVYPIKGTPLYEEVQHISAAALPWAERTDRDIAFPRSYPGPYYYFAIRWTVNALQWHKTKLAGQLLGITGLVLALKITIARAGMLWWRWQK